MAVTFTISRDTSPDVQAWFHARWRSMPPAKKAELADRLSEDCTTLALAGIRALNPDANPASIRYQLALRRYGKELADEVYR